MNHRTSKRRADPGSFAQPMLWLLSLFVVTIPPTISVGQPSPGSSEPGGPGEDVADDASSGIEASTEVAAQIFTGWRYDVQEGDDFNAFTLDRAEVGIDHRWRSRGTDRAGIEVRVESIRSADEDSVFGIDGDSLLLRVKRAHAFASVPLGQDHALSADGGLIPESWTESIERRYSLRGVASTLSERGRFFDTSDLGARLIYDGWGGRVRAAAQWTNGEGRNERERNSGKNATLLLEGVAFRHDAARGPVSIALHGAYRDGSVGTGSARNHRIAAALTFVAPCPSAGLELVRALGHDGRADREASGISAWVASFLGTHWAGVGFRYDRLDSGTGLDDDDSNRYTIALFSDLFDDKRPIAQRRIRLYVAAVIDRVGDNAPPLSGAPAAVESESLQLRLEANGRRRFNVTSDQ